MLTYTADARFRVKHASEASEWTLEIKFLQKRDEGTYYCQVPIRMLLYFNRVDKSLCFRNEEITIFWITDPLLVVKAKQVIIKKEKRTLSGVYEHSHFWIFTSFFLSSASRM